MVDKIVELENNKSYSLKGIMSIMSNEDTFTYNVDANKSKDGYYKADFTKIRDLAMFAINYEREHLREPVERPIRPVKDIEMAIEHYTLLLESSVLEEENEAYQNKLDRLEKELEYTEKATMIRRRKNDITKN